MDRRFIQPRHTLRATALLVLLMGMAQLAHAVIIIDPEITTNCGMPCESNADCEAHASSTDIDTCMTCMPTGTCGNPQCFDSCATNAGCPPECPICSFQQCLSEGEDGTPISCDAE